MIVKAKAQPTTIITAVSGGVDSVVILHQLVEQKQPMVVAHFDHGIREDSGADARFVEGLAKAYGLPFELGQGKLGPKTSEEAARTARQAFLKSVQEKHGSRQIATAHHQDDVLETAIINILRGTGRRGMSSLGDTTLYSRPLIKWTKSQIYDYATQHQLEWVEDETNRSDDYLRNRIRHRLLPLMKKRGLSARWGGLVDWFYTQNPAIDKLLQEVYLARCEKTPDHVALPLALLNDRLVPAELVHLILRKQEARGIDAAEVTRLLSFAQTAKPGDRFNQFPPLTILKSKDWLLFQ